MVLFSIIRLVLCMPYRYANRSHKVIGTKTWIALFVLEVIGACFMFGFKHIKGSNTFGSCLIDTITLFGMFVMYKIEETRRAGDGAELASN